MRCLCHGAAGDTPFFILNDYLTSLESFIGAEINERSDYLGNLHNEHIEDDDYENVIRFEYSRRNTNLQIAKEFHSVLRSSFFSNMCAYIESFLINECHKRDKKN